MQFSNTLSYTFPIWTFWNFLLLFWKCGTVGLLFTIVKVVQAKMFCPDDNEQRYITLQYSPQGSFLLPRRLVCNVPYLTFFLKKSCCRLEGCVSKWKLQYNPKDSFPSLDNLYRRSNLPVLVKLVQFWQTCNNLPSLLWNGFLLSNSFCFYFF